MADTVDLSIFRTVLTYSISIILLPIISFFGSKIIVFESIIGASGTTSNVCSAIIAVIVLHIALGLFILRAYSDPDKSRIEKKDDKID